MMLENRGVTLGERYMANTCPSCHAFVGRGHLHEYYDLMLPENATDLGAICARCHGQER